MTANRNVHLQGLSNVHMFLLYGFINERKLFVLKQIKVRLHFSQIRCCSVNDVLSYITVLHKALCIYLN